MSAPRRIQRKRTKGWRMPEGAVYVGRPTRWGNPFPLRTDPPHAPEARARVVARYRDWLTTTGGEPLGGAKRGAILRELDSLRGKDLACWCPPDQPCHADVLLDLANGGRA